MWIFTTPFLMLVGGAAALMLAWAWIRAMFTDDKKARRDRARADRRQWTWVGVWGLLLVVPAVQVAFLGYTTWKAGGFTTSAWIQAAAALAVIVLLVPLIRWFTRTDREPPKALDYRHQRERRIFWDPRRGPQEVVRRRLGQGRGVTDTRTSAAGGTPGGHDDGARHPRANGPLPCSSPPKR